MSQLSVSNRDQEGAVSDRLESKTVGSQTLPAKPPYHRVSIETLVKCFGTYYLAKDSKRIHLPQSRRSTPPEISVSVGCTVWARATSITPHGYGGLVQCRFAARGRRGQPPSRALLRQAVTVLSNLFPPAFAGLEGRQEVLMDIRNGAEFCVNQPQALGSRDAAAATFASGVSLSVTQNYLTGLGYPITSSRGPRGA